MIQTSDFYVHKNIEQNVRLDIESFHQNTTVQIHVTFRRMDIIVKKPVLVPRRTAITSTGVLKQVDVTEMGKRSRVSYQIIKFYRYIYPVQCYGIIITRKMQHLCIIY